MKPATRLLHAQENCALPLDRFHAFAHVGKA